MCVQCKTKYLYWYATNSTVVCDDSVYSFDGVTCNTEITDCSQLACYNMGTTADPSATNYSGCKQCTDYKMHSGVNTGGLGSSCVTGNIVNCMTYGLDSANGVICSGCDSDYVTTYNQTYCLKANEYNSNCRRLTESNISCYSCYAAYYFNVDTCRFKAYIYNISLLLPALCFILS